MPPVNVPFLFNHVQVRVTRGESREVGLVDRRGILLGVVYIVEIWKSFLFFLYVVLNLPLCIFRLLLLPIFPSSSLTVGNFRA